MSAQEAGEMADSAADGSPSVVVKPVTRAGAHWIVFLGIAIAVIVLDQVSKAWIVANISPGDVVELVGDLVRLVLSQNSGALFGLFRDNAAVFGLVSIGVIGLIVVYHARAGRSLYLSIALGLLLGGAIGNLTDRLRIGYVVDFVDMGLGTLRFYTFNLGDSAITVAILMLIVAALWPAVTDLVDRPDRARPATDGATDGLAHG